MTLGQRNFISAKVKYINWRPSLTLVLNCVYFFLFYAQPTDYSAVDNVWPKPFFLLFSRSFIMKFIYSPWLIALFSENPGDMLSPRQRCLLSNYIFIAAMFSLPFIRPASLHSSRLFVSKRSLYVSEARASLTSTGRPGRPGMGLGAGTGAGATRGRIHKG